MSEYCPLVLYSALGTHPGLVMVRIEALVFRYRSCYDIVGCLHHLPTVRGAALNLSSIHLHHASTPAESHLANSRAWQKT